MLLLEKNDYIGGATTSQKVFPDYDARLFTHAYSAHELQSTRVHIHASSIVPKILNLLNRISCIELSSAIRG